MQNKTQVRGRYSYPHHISDLLYSCSTCGAHRRNHRRPYRHTHRLVHYGAHRGIPYRKTLYRKTPYRGAPGGW